MSWNSGRETRRSAKFHSTQLASSMSPSTILKTPMTTDYLLVIKVALERNHERCSTIVVDGHILPLSQEWKSSLRPPIWSLDDWDGVFLDFAIHVPC